MNVIVSWVLVVLLIVSGISLVALIATPVLDRSKAALELQNAENALDGFVDAVKAVAAEGNGSSRVVSIPQGEWDLQNNTVSYRIATDALEAGTREVSDIEKLSGSDAQCYERNDFIMENSLLLVKLRRQQGEVTSDNILEIRNKGTGTAVTPEDSSITIDGVASSRAGAGFSEISEASGAKCTVRYPLDSKAGISYGIFYTLYSGADFLTVEVENVAE